jgi:ABC-type polysaccharide/polyol phosphate transport system ATPase subunit
VFEAELLEETVVVDENLEYALEVKNASWSWDAPPEQIDNKKKKSKSMDNNRFARKDRKKNEKTAEKSPEEKAKEEEKIFKVQDVSFKIPRGELVAVVGPVGSGKSSLLQGLIGEMRQTSGDVLFGASVSYCPQSAWIQACFNH